MPAVTRERCQYSSQSVNLSHCSQPQPHFDYSQAAGLCLCRLAHSCKHTLSPTAVPSSAISRSCHRTNHTQPHNTIFSGSCRVM